MVAVLGSEAARVRRESEEEFQRLLKSGALNPDLSLAHRHSAAGLELHFETHRGWKRGMLSSAQAGLSWALGHKPSGVLVLPRAVTPVAASARITGKYSGRAPAMTAFTATFSTVYSQYSRKCVERIRPTTSSGRRLVWASIAATRSSVGRTMGSLSVQSLSRKRWWRFTSLSGSTSHPLLFTVTLVGPPDGPVWGHFAA